ncbi:MAG: ATP-binding protein [Chlorobiales bacterium]|nr:ATP-binding protein [Chlorobiales bacterium]
MDGRKTKMKLSLQRRLTLMLSGAIVVAALVAATASFYFSYQEAKEFQDDMLRQIAELQIRSVGKSEAAEALSEPSTIVSLSDPESMIRILHFRKTNTPEWLRGSLLPGFHTVRQGGAFMRLFIVQSPSMITVVVQPTDTRDEIAIGSALRTLLPAMLLLPVMALLVMRIVRSALKPVGALSHLLDEQQIDKPIRLPERDIPEEIMPFVDAINRLLGRISCLLSQQRRFIADAAHELRSPLTALSLQAENLRQARTSDEMLTRLVPLQAGIERARQLTVQLLNLARVQAQPSDVVLVDLPALARELIAEYLPLAEARGIDLGLEEPGSMMLEGNPESFNLILKNGLENALNYTHQGGLVTIRLVIENGDGVIEVIDNGSGIPDAERQRVFDAFYRSPGSGQPGSGLGLTIAREAALSLGGDLSLLSGSDGRGTVFRYRQRVGECDAIPG